MSFTLSPLASCKISGNNLKCPEWQKDSSENTEFFTSTSIVSKIYFIFEAIGQEFVRFTSDVFSTNHITFVLWLGTSSFFDQPAFGRRRPLPGTRFPRYAERFEAASQESLHYPWLQPVVQMHWPQLKTERNNVDKLSWFKGKIWALFRYYQQRILHKEINNCFIFLIMQARRLVFRSVFHSNMPIAGFSWGTNYRTWKSFHGIEYLWFW